MAPAGMQGRVELMGEAQGEDRPRRLSRDRRPQERGWRRQGRGGGRTEERSGRPCSGEWAGEVLRRRVRELLVAACFRRLLVRKGGGVRRCHEGKMWLWVDAKIRRLGLGHHASLQELRQGLQN